MLKKVARFFLFRKGKAQISNLKISKAEQAILIDEIRQEVGEIEVKTVELDSKAHENWANNMNQLKNLILTENIDFFLQWAVIKRTMYVDKALYIFKELKFLKNLPDFNLRWKNYLIESSVGNPNCYKRLLNSSSNLVHQTYHIAMWENTLGKKIEGTDLILEFGGGYGALCKLIHSMSFKKKYVIFDLAIFSKLQKYYLKSLNLPVLEYEEFILAKSGIICVSEFKILQKIIDNSNVSLSDSLFIASWSLSETSMDVRNSFMPLIKKFNSFFIGYQPYFGEVDNNDYFDNFKKILININWKTIDIVHYIGNNKYLFGKKDDNNI